MHRVRQRWAAQLLIACATTTAVAAEPEAVSEAARHFKLGVQLHGEGNLDAALAEFTRANELAPSYRLLYNMAKVHGDWIARYFEHLTQKDIDKLMDLLAALKDSTRESILARQAP